MWHLLIPKCISDPRRKPKAYANPVFRPMREPNEAHSVHVGLEAAVALNMHNLHDSLVSASSNSPLHAGLHAATAEGLPYMHQAPSQLQLSGDTLSYNPTAMQAACTLSSSYVSMSSFGPEITPATPEGYALVRDQACVKDTNRPAHFLPLGKQHPASTSSISKSNSSSSGAGLTHQQYCKGLQYSSQAVHTHPHTHLMSHPAGSVTPAQSDLAVITQQLATAQLAAQQAQSYASLLAQHTTAAHNTVTAMHNRLATLRVQLADSAVFADSTYQTLHREIVLLERDAAAAIEQFESLKQSLTAAQYDASRKQAVVEQLLQQAYSQQQQQQVVIDILPHTLGASLSCPQLGSGSTAGGTELDSFTAAGRELRHSRLFIPIEAPFASLSPAAAAADALLLGMQYSVPTAPNQASVLPADGSSTSSQSGVDFPLVPLPPAEATSACAAAAAATATGFDAASDAERSGPHPVPSPKQAKTPFAGATGAAAARTVAASDDLTAPPAADQTLTRSASMMADTTRRSISDPDNTAGATTAAAVAPAAALIAVQHSAPASVPCSASAVDQQSDLRLADLAVANSSSAKLFKSFSGRLSEHGEPSVDWSPFTRRSTTAVSSAAAVQSQGGTAAGSGDTASAQTVAFFISNGSWGGSSTGGLSTGSSGSARPPARAALSLSRSQSVRGIGSSSGGDSNTSTSRLAARRASLTNSISTSTAGKSGNARPASGVTAGARSSAASSSGSKAVTKPVTMASVGRSAAAGNSAAVRRSQAQSAPGLAGVVGLRASSSTVQAGSGRVRASARGVPAEPVGTLSAVKAGRMASLTATAARRMSSPGSIGAPKGTAAGHAGASIRSSGSNPGSNASKARPPGSTAGVSTNATPTGGAASDPPRTSNAGRYNSSNISLRRNSEAGTAVQPNGRYSSTAGSAASRYSSTGGIKGGVQRYSSSTDGSSSSDSDTERDSLSQAARLASRRVRQPGDLAPHVAKLQVMYAEEVSAEWEDVKGNLKGRR